PAGTCRPRRWPRRARRRRKRRRAPAARSAPGRPGRTGGRPRRAPPGGARPPVGPKALVQPAVPVRGGDPLRLAPFEERGDQRRAVPVLFEPPRAGIGYVDPGPREQRLDLGGAA